MATNNVSEVVVGSTRTNLLVTVVDETGAPINITGGSVRLQGTTNDIPNNTIDVAGVIHDAVNGVAKWSSIGGTSFVTTNELGALSEATYNLRVKFTDSNALVSYGPEFQITWKKPPV